MTLPRGWEPREASEPRAGIARLLLKLRGGGANWLQRRLALELTAPTTAPGQWLHREARKLLSIVLMVRRKPHRRTAGKSGTETTLFAFYDLKVAPVTFDFIWFLAAADLLRRRLGLLDLHIVIVPGPFHGVRDEGIDYEKVIDPPARRWRIHNILVPACALLPVPCAVTIASSRNQVAAMRAMVPGPVYPIGYETLLPNRHHPNDCLIPARTEHARIAVLRAENHALRLVNTWLAGRQIDAARLITITLRGYSYMPARNSTLDYWVAFAERLDPTRFVVVFVPDVDQTLQRPLPMLAKFLIYPEVAWNVELRMALYERAYLNLGVNGGPLSLCWFNERTRYITFRMITASVPQSTMEYARTLGFEIGESLPFATEFQEWLWDQDDSVPFIERAFNAMVTRIEAQGNG